MGVRSRIGRAGFAARLRGSLFALAIVGFGTVPGVWQDAGARQAGLAMQHHATVLNGSIVGSAFAVADGIVVTNAHVVRGLDPGAGLEVVASGGQRARAVGRLVAVSPRMDLAVLAVPQGFLPVVSSGSVANLSGLAVTAAGVDASGARPGLPRLELTGHVVATARDLPAFGPGLIARLPGVKPGFSGGPMLDERGRLVGMIAAIRPGQPQAASRTVAASGFAPRQARPSVAREAYVLDAAALRNEVRRLLARLNN